MRNVRNGEQRFVQLLLDGRHILVDLGNAIACSAHFQLDGGNVLAGLLFDADFLGDRIAPVLERLDLGKKLTALLVQIEERIQADGRVAIQ